MVKLLQIVILSIFMLYSSISYANLHNRNINKQNKIISIGIIPFEHDGLNYVQKNIMEIIFNDLNNSGKFNILNINNDSIIQEINYSSNIESTIWSTLNVEIVLIGKIKKIINNKYLLSYKLIDTGLNPGKILIENKYKSSKNLIRYVSHHISDDIFENVTNIKSVFRTRIAYVVYNKDNQYPYELQISDYDGYNKNIIHSSLQPIMSPTWSPNSNHIAYVLFEKDHSKLVIQNLNSGVIRKITNFKCHNGAPSFSPDGTKLAFTLSKDGNFNIYIKDLNSSKINQITNGNYNDTEPFWFPDNETLVYTSDQNGHPQLYKINTVENSKPKRISWKGYQNHSANISLNGKFIVMVSNNNNKQYISKLDLLNGTNQILTNNLLDENPTISPNNEMIIYSSNDGVDSVLQLISMNGRSKFTLPLKGKIRFPAWSKF